MVEGQGLKAKNQSQERKANRQKLSSPAAGAPRRPPSPTDLLPEPPTLPQLKEVDKPVFCHLSGPAHCRRSGKCSGGDRTADLATCRLGVLAIPGASARSVLGLRCGGQAGEHGGTG